MLFEIIKLALHAIRRDALRSFPTVLGVVSVIALVTIGNATSARVTADSVNSAAGGMRGDQPRAAGLVAADPG